MSSKQSDCKIKNSVWYQQHLEKLKNKRKQDENPSSGAPKESETYNSAKKATLLPFTDKPGGSPAAEVSKKEPPQTSNIYYPNLNSAPPCGRGPMPPIYTQGQNLMFGAMHGPMFRPPFMGPRHSIIPGFTPLIRNKSPWQSNSQSFLMPNQDNKNILTQGERVSSTPADAEYKTGVIGTNTVKTLLEKPAAVKNDQFALWQPENNDTSVMELTKPDADENTVQVEKRTVEPPTPAEKKPEQSEANNPSAMTLIPVAKDQPTVKVDIRSQIEMVLDKINKKFEDSIARKAGKPQNDKATAEKSDAYLEHMKKLQEKASLQKDPESENGKLGVSISNVIDMPHSDAYLEHLEKLRAKNRPNEEVSTYTGQQHAKPTEVVSLNKPETSKLASYGKTSQITVRITGPMTDQQHLHPNQVPPSARTGIVLKPTSSPEKTRGTDKAPPVTTKIDLPSSAKTYATSRECVNKPAVAEKTNSFKATPMQIKKEVSPYSTSQLCAGRQQNPYGAKQSRSPHGQQATGSTWGQSLVDDASSRSSHAQSEPVRDLPISDMDGFLTLDSTFAEDMHTCEKNNSWTQQRPKSSDFFENSTNREETDEPKLSSVTQSHLRSILKRNQSDDKDETIPTKIQRCDSETRVKSNLPSLEPDMIEVMPSLPEDSQHQFANMRDDNAPAGLDFIHPVSGYHCALCNTFSRHYSTVLHHCTLLTHKMKIQKAQSLKNT